MDEQQEQEQEQPETKAPPRKKSTAKKRITRKRTKRAPKPLDDASKQATNKTAGVFTAEMLTAGANVVRIKELDTKRHGCTGFAEWPDKTRITLTITSKG